MYKVQFVNAYTQDILREEEYKEIMLILEMVSSFEQNKDKNEKLNNPSYIFDHQRRTWEAFYLSHVVVEEEKCRIYKLFFKVKMSEIQAIIR
ncbi:hypothetical protein D0469_07095 [Peribacillus saganii]|uniref:Uncharacterized protein n=1 Tax=Peribacillus saganii TaxID=2303992 RepID=A0A372LRB1_9BACI|nr:hypothetical protein [Peribacillus saganii]RFU70360.1 hypothetical protein D0469_07095 [Peribacillus saganii]